MANVSSITLLVISVLIAQNVEGYPRVDPLVDTKVGLIRGQQATDGDYAMFLGIPFAQVDETNPFGPSTPYPAFEETFDAYDDTARCPQVDEFNGTIVGSLDCLHLNVYVPSSASSQNRLPVLVWIFGGGYVTGFAGRYVYGPKFLVRHDIILVTLNYRLGPYGFMCLDIPEVPGNQGLRDQLTGLRWIKENIESFGGDSNKITIFGESAGGVSVDYHFISDKEKLYNQVLLQSGSTLIPEMIGEPDYSSPLKLADKLGLVTDDLKEALTFLATVDTKQVIAVASEVGRFSACVEKDFENVEQFVRDYPVNTDVPKARDMKILIGNNNDEGVVSHVNQDENYYNTLNVFYDKLDTTFDFEEDELLEMEDIVRRFYIGDAEISEEVVREIIEFDNDFNFYHAIGRTISKYLENGAANVYYYIFSYTGERNFYKISNNVTVGGAAHADELGYIFDVEPNMPSEISPEDQLIIDRITTLWANFVKYGDPTPETSELLPVKWEPMTREGDFIHLDIDSELTLGGRPVSRNMAFWDLFYKLNGHKQRGYRGANAQ